MDQMIENQNQRKSTRYIRRDIVASLIKQNIFGFKTKINCKLKDVSSTGVQIATPHKLKVNSVIILVLNFDDEEEFQIKAQVVSQKELHSYISIHKFPTIESLKNQESSLSTLHLYESANKRILAKFRKLTNDSVKVLTYSPLNKRHPYNLVFTLENGETLKTDAKIVHYQQIVNHSYGIKFEKSNDDLGESLLETQTALVFK